MGAKEWKNIWNRRVDRFDEIDLSDVEQVFIEMKRIDGWDFHGGKPEISYEEFRKEYEYTKRNLRLQAGDSVFEVGCGCGANLYLFHLDGIRVGGLDYAEHMLDLMKKIFREDDLLEALCGEAADLDVSKNYDAVLSAGAFSYFSDQGYAEQVLDRMLRKTKYSMGIMRVMDEETQEEFVSYRRAHVKNYDELYRNLPKLFYSKRFFTKYAECRDLEIKFSKQHMENFWNEPFVFDCFMYRRDDRK